MAGKIEILDCHEAYELQRQVRAARNVDELKVVVIELIEKIYNGANGGHAVVEGSEE